MKPDRPYTIQLEAAVSDANILLMGEQLSLAAAETVETWETITRVVKFDDDYYGEVELTKKMLSTMIDNFNANVFGQDLSIDLSHDFSGGSAGFIRELKLEGNDLRGRIEWTDHGREAVTKKGFRYFSADYHPNYKNPETNQKHGPLLQGAALTTRPRVKNLAAVDPGPLQLSAHAADDRHIAITPLLTRQLTTEIVEMKEKYLAILLAAIAGFTLSDDLVNGIKLGWEAAMGSTTDDAAAKIITDGFISQAKAINSALKLAAQPAPPGRAADPAPVQLSADDIAKMVTDQLAAQQQQQTEDALKLSQSESAQRNRFKTALDAHEGFKGITELQRAGIYALGDSITALHTDASVDGLVASAIQLCDQAAVAAQLQARGYGAPGGSVRMTETDADLVTKLQGQIDENLKLSDKYHQKELKLSDPPAGSFASKMLAQFDRQNIRRLHQESIALANGEVGISDTDLPVGFQRTVIRESVADENIMGLIDASTAPGATQTTQIPYEIIDESQLINDGIIYEGQPIAPGGVRQEMDMAYLFPMKMSMNVTNEVLHFTRASDINWDAWARNVQTNAQVMRKLTARLVANSMQRSADSYGAVDVSAEAFDAQLTGSNNLIKTVLYPIVRPHQERNVKGEAIGSPSNPITLTLNGTELAEYDGSGDQVAGTYYRVTNYNIGYIQLVDETGAPVTPTDSGVNTLDYSYASNVVMFDLDIPGGSKKKEHYDDLLALIGSQKAMMEADRYVTPNFALGRPILLDIISQAESFTDSGQRKGTDANAEGDTSTVKAIPMEKTNALSDIGDERLMLGGRGAVKFRVAKAWQMEPVTEAIDPTTGRPVGKKVAYGEQLVGIKTPIPLRDRFSSVIAYSFSNR